VPCVFCHADGTLSREHVYPRWPKPLFPDFGEADYVRRLVSAASEEEHLRPGKLFDVVVRDVCADCNNGWMADLESQVQPALTSMVLDRPRVLTAPEQHTLATWATKTMLMLQCSNIGGQRFVADSEYRLFADHVAPLPGSQVWLCRYGGDGNWPLLAHQWGVTMRPADEPQPQVGDETNGFGVLFTVGPVAFWLWRHSLRGGPYAESGSDDAHLLIWPALGADVRWPPRETLQTEAELKELSRRMPTGVEPRGLPLR
jgi:hypothetical protein